MNELIIASAGTGAAEQITPEVIKALRNSDLIFASERFKDFIEPEKFIALKNFQESFEKIKTLLNENKKILILLSGDAGVFSLLPLVKKFFSDSKIKVLPGLSSLQVLAARAGESWSSAEIFSGHGRELPSGKFLNAVERNEKVFLFCDKKISPAWACEKLSKEIPEGKLKIFIGSNLGSPEEIFLAGSPEEFAKKIFPELSIMLVKNHEVYSRKNFFPRDKDFIREKNIVMTHEAVRAAIISRLELDNNSSVLWDIGAGSGSISVTAALENLELEVHAVEYKPEALNLISSNAKKFHLHNIKIHAGRALSIIKNLPAPSHIFIGGSGGELPEILSVIKNFKPEKFIRLVIACVTLETLTTAFNFMKDLKNFEALEISAAFSKSLGPSLNLMSAKNPVTILSGELE